MFRTVEPNRDKDRFIFQGGIGASASPQVIAWTVPSSAKGIRFTLIGGGSGGGHATIGVSGTTRSSGAGGNSGGMTTLTFLASLLPSTLYLKCGTGGIGSTTSGVNGSLGTITTISTDPAGLYVLGYANGGTTAGSAAPIAAAASSMQFAHAALSWYAIGGSLGQAASAAAGVSGIGVNANILMGGASGGGVDTTDAFFAGGGITANATFPFFSAIPGPATIGSQGSSGYWSWKPMFGLGGCGGAGSTGTCGIGGDGAYGCGGGGTGGGNAVSRSGSGGPGLIIINCW